MIAVQNEWNKQLSFQSPSSAKNYHALDSEMPQQNLKFFLFKLAATSISMSFNTGQQYRHATCIKPVTAAFAPVLPINL